MKSRKTVVLGQQLADARANEAARLAAGDLGVSPMPMGAYDWERGDYDLLLLTACPLDAELQTLIRTFAASSADSRAEMQRRIHMNEQYTLILFAKRCAVLSLREKSAARCEHGLTALAMVDETRIDPRDAAMAVGILSHALEAYRADRESLVDRAMSLARPGMSSILAGAREGSRLSEWGYTEIRPEGGSAGLVRSGYARYEPTLDLTGLALRLSAALQRGRYITRPELAVDVPAVWFEKGSRSRAERLLKKARAAVAVTGTLREAYHAKPFEQLFIQWVVEMPTTDEADALVRYVGVNTTLGSRFVIGVASGRLFSLLVAGSSTEGVDSFESPESLRVIANDSLGVIQDAVR